MGYLVSWMLAFLIIGSIWYVIDRLFGVKLYRWFYDMTHRDPLPDAQYVGFIYRRKAQARFFSALVIAVGQGAVISSNTHDGPLIELLTFIFQIPVLMLGFYLGPFVFRLWENKEDLFEQVDKIESGEIALRDELKEVAEKAVHVVKDTLAASSVPETKAEAATDVLPTPAQEILPQESPDPSPQEMMHKYLRRD